VSKNNNNEYNSKLVSKVSFFLLDIDDFTKYNLTYSFEKGNEILNKIETLIKSLSYLKNYKKIDGDEFLFSCYGEFKRNKTYIFSLMQKIENELHITVSIGAIESLQTTDNFQELHRDLQLSLLIAKNNGKNKLFINL